MRRGDDVFFFTLIDFLLQVAFFGLVLFIAWQASQPEPPVQDVLKAAGVSNLTELNDVLTRLAPVKERLGDKDFIDRHGGRADIDRAMAAVKAAGGPKHVGDLAKENKELNRRIAQLEGWGKVSCLPNVTAPGRVRPQTIARVVVRDDRIELEAPTDEMRKLLAEHGLDFNAVSNLSLSAFRSTFAPVVARQPECRYFLSVETQTKYLEPMRTVWSAFRTL